MARRKKSTDSFSYNRVLKMADFEAFGARYRKEWEIQMALKTLRELGATGPDALIIGIGAGRERTIFELANADDAKMVYATDIYYTPGVWKDWHGTEFLKWPANFSPPGVNFETRRITAEHADMRYLPYEDEMFDAFFSSGSIEHVGKAGIADYPAIEQAAREMGRVLKPGGIGSLSTEWLIDGNGWGWGHVRLFTEELLMKHIVEPSGLELVDEPDFEFDGDLDHFVRLAEIVQGRATGEGYGLIKDRGYLFTSVHLALRKPEDPMDLIGKEE